MTAIIQSAFASLLGLALAVLGIIHSISRYPGSQTFAQVYGLPVAISAARVGSIRSGYSRFVQWRSVMCA